MHYLYYKSIETISHPTRQDQCTSDYSGFGDSVITTLQFDKDPTTMGGALGITILWFFIFAAQSLLALHYFPRMRASNLFRRIFGD